MDVEENSNNSSKKAEVILQKLEDATDIVHLPPVFSLDSKYIAAHFINLKSIVCLNTPCPCKGTCALLLDVTLEFTVLTLEIGCTC